MKKLLTACILLVVMMTANSDAQVLSSSWHPTHAVVVADTVTATQVTAYVDTSRTFYLLQQGYAWQYLYPTIYVRDRDTVLLGDTLNFILEVSATGEAWTLWDTIRVAPASTNDSTIIWAPRMKLDSTPTTGYNIARVRTEWVYWLVHADSGLIGNTYDLWTELIFNGRN